MASAARASPGPMDGGQGVLPVTGASKRRTEPSGSVMAGMSASLGKAGGLRVAGPVWPYGSAAATLSRRGRSARSGDAQCTVTSTPAGRAGAGERRVALAAEQHDGRASHGRGREVHGAGVVAHRDVRARWPGSGQQGQKAGAPRQVQGGGAHASGPPWRQRAASCGGAGHHGHQAARGQHVAASWPRTASAGPPLARAVQARRRERERYLPLPLPCSRRGPR